eukprot:1637763-Prorocentrum_lima.AAC.1
MATAKLVVQLRPDFLAFSDVDLAWRFVRMRYNLGEGTPPASPRSSSYSLPRAPVRRLPSTGDFHEGP